VKGSKNARGLTLDYGDCIVRNDSGGIELLTFKDVTMVILFSMPTYADGPLTTRCPSCGMQHSSRERKCPACVVGVEE